MHKTNPSSIYLSLIISVFLSMSLVACGGDSASTPDNPTPPPAPAPCGQIDGMEQCVSLQVNNFPERYFILREPANRMDLAPVVIFLHGGGLNPQSIINYTDARTFVDNAGYLAVVPVGSGGFWDWSSEVTASAELSEDSQLVSGIIDLLVANNQADPDRIYVIGYSAGSLMAYQLACEIPDLINAVVALSGQIRGDVDDCVPNSSVTIHHIHGASDTDTPTNGDADLSSLTDTLALWSNVNNCSAMTNDSAGFSLTTDNNTAITTSYEGCSHDLYLTMVLNGDHNLSYNIDALHDLMLTIFQ